MGCIVQISYVYRQLWKQSNNVDYYVLWAELSDDVDNVERALQSMGFSDRGSKIIEGVYGLYFNGRVFSVDGEMYEKGEDSSYDIAKILGEVDTSKIPPSSPVG